ncbi:transesterase [Xylaria intraflava]|nr:transesterase [Xylaria intraflava]
MPYFLLRNRSVDKQFRKAVADGRIHGAVLLAKDLTGRKTNSGPLSHSFCEKTSDIDTGKVDISRSYGVRSLHEEDPEKRPPMSVDTPMRIASCTKLITSIMVLRCFEQGLVDPNESVERLLPEIAKSKVLTGFDEAGNPIEREPKSPILLKHLLTHSSGLGYATLSPLLTQYREWQGLSPKNIYDDMEQCYKYPLLFDPGTRWTYGASLDWCARLISRASGMSTEEYLQKHVVEPLGISPETLTFEAYKYPELEARAAGVIFRDGDTLKASPVGPGKFEDESYWHRKTEAFGGEGLFATPASYMKVLWSILSDDGKLLKSETRKLLFEPALSPEAEKSCTELFSIPLPLGIPAPAGLKYSHSLGGRLTLEDSDGDRWRRAGNLSWGGYTNIIWNIDVKAGICSLWAFHSLPFGNPAFMDLGTEFEKAAFGMLKQ